MARLVVHPSLHGITVMILLLLLGVLPGCSGSSGGQVDNLATYDIAGRITDNTGTPLVGVQIEFNGNLAMTGVDGRFVLEDNPHGTGGALLPSSTGITFLPESRTIAVDRADVTGLEFVGFAIASLEDNMPFVGQAQQQLTILLRAVDSAGVPLDGYTCDEGTIASSPAGIVVLTSPAFTDGEATAVVRFENQGTYAICLEGFCEKLNVTLGTIQIGPGSPQTDAVQVETWMHGAEAAISLSFDDGSQDHWTRGLALWEEYGFNVTLGILANRFLDNPERLPQLQQAFDAGHELANHTTTHPDLTTQTAAATLTEIRDCHQLLLDNVVGLEGVYTFIYPYELYSDEVIAALQDEGYMFARSGTQDMVQVTALNEPWNPSLYHLYAWANLNTLSQSFWNDTTDRVLAEGGWLVEECHGIGAIGETGVGWSPRPESEYRDHYDHIKSYGDRIWVAPIGEVGRYLVERNNARCTVVEQTADRIAFGLTTGLDVEIYNIPLTIWLNKPAGWESLRVVQNAAELPVSENAQGRVRFQVVPGTDIVTIERLP